MFVSIFWGRSGFHISAKVERMGFMKKKAEEGRRLGVWQVSTEMSRDSVQFGHLISVVYIHYVDEG